MKRELRANSGYFVRQFLFYVMYPEKLNINS